MSISSRLAKIKQDFPQSFLTLSYLAYLDASSITVDQVNEFFSSESSDFTENVLNQLMNDSLITKNNKDIFIDPLVQKETVELIDKETKIIIINNIVYSLNNLITDDDIQDLRFTNEQRVLKLFKNVVKIHQNFWENTYKSEYSAELIKKLGNLNEEYFMNFDQALNNYHDVLAIYEAILPANDLRIPDLYNNIGAVYAKLGINEKALNTYNQALMLYEG
jgi:tetratricopeptide (TPR) repeat protein